MAASRMHFLSGLLVFCIIANSLEAQDLSWNDSANALIFRPVFPVINGRFSIKSALNYSISVSGYHFLNGPSDKTTAQLAFLQNLKYSFSLSSFRFQMTNDLVHNLGLIYYIDSISKFQTDENTLTTRLSYQPVKKYVQLTASSAITTRIFNLYDISQGSGGSVIRTINSSFLTPLVCTFSCGIGFNLIKTGTLDIGIGSAKLTCINDPYIFEKTGKDTFFGIVKGHTSLLEYGLSMHLIIDRLIAKKMQWNCDFLLFKTDKTGVEMTVRNLFAYKINRFLKTSLQTKLLYDEDVSMKLRMENLISLGFDFHL